MSNFENRTDFNVPTVQKEVFDVTQTNLGGFGS